jgi:LacI family transcriptional regulator
LVRFKAQWSGADVANSVSIKEVARRAGVSLGTVSNVLNNPAVVQAATRERVEQAIAELGYVRNESARQLRAGRSRTIAYVVLDASNPFFTDVARGAQRAAEAEALGLYICNSNADADTEHRYLELLVEQRVRGLLVTPVDPHAKQLAQVAKRGVAIVMVDRSTDNAMCSVSVDDVAGGSLAVAHLLDLGHRRIAFVGGPAGLPQIVDRLEGARKALRNGGLDETTLAVVPVNSMNAAQGRIAGEQVAAMPAEDRPTAVFCANDLLALGFLQEMTRRGVKVPQDIALIGYDDIEFAETAAVPLTSIRQPREELGRMAAELLMDEANPGHHHRQVQFQAELVVRASTTGFDREPPRKPAAQSRKASST